MNNSTTYLECQCMCIIPTFKPKLKIKNTFIFLYYSSTILKNVEEWDGHFYEWAHQKTGLNQMWPFSCIMFQPPICQYQVIVEVPRIFSGPKVICYFTFRDLKQFTKWLKEPIFCLGPYKFIFNAQFYPIFPNKYEHWQLKIGGI